MFNRLKALLRRKHRPTAAEQRLAAALVVQPDAPITIKVPVPKPEKAPEVGPSKTFRIAG